MFARVWWKDWRQMRPAWLGLIAMAAGVHALALAFGSGTEERQGIMTPFALGWAGLYVIAAGAAAFAGEREGDTLRFLDGLPVDRRTLWIGKATFVIGSTLGLAVVLVLLSRLGVFFIAPKYAIGRYAPIALLLLGEAAAWSLFWSALAGNALNAAVLAIVTAGLIWGGTIGRLDEVGIARDMPAVSIRLVAGLLALVASWALFTRRPRPERFTPRARSLEGLATGSEADAKRVSWVSAARGLAWQTYREGRATAAVLFLIGVVVPYLGAIDVLDQTFTLLGSLACLAAGVSAFSPENQAGTHRFLAQQGVRPTLAWAIKVASWAGFVLACGLILLGILLVTGALGPWLGRQRIDGESAVLIPASLALAFAVGQLAGMVIRRRITAGVVAGLGLFAIAVPLFWLLSLGMIPPRGFLLPAPVLLAISWAWSGDWMLDRPGARRWIHLAALATGGLGLLAMLYIGHRALGVPDTSLPFDPATVRAEVVPPDQNAAEPYRRALEILGASSPAADLRHGSRIIPRIGAEQQDLALAEIRRAAALPRLRFRQLGAGDLPRVLDPAFAGIPDLTRVVIDDARERREAGDLAGAWDDVRTLLAISEQLATAGSLGQAGTALAVRRSALSVHHEAMVLGMKWAADPGQTPGSLRSALADLRERPPLPRLDETIRREYLLLDRTLDLPSEVLSDFLSGRRTFPDLGQRLGNLVFTPAWERERARRAARWMVVEQLHLVDLEPWRRTTVPSLLDPEYWKGSPLLRSLNFYFPSDQGDVDWENLWLRALEQVLALRAWQLDHEGRYPEALAELVPTELTALPRDPYSGRPFGYVRSEGQSVLSLGEQGDRPGSYRPADMEPTRPGQPLLYSVGADLEDDRGEVIPRSGPASPGRGDVVFPMPERVEDR